MEKKVAKENLPEGSAIEVSLLLQQLKRKFQRKELVEKDFDALINDLVLTKNGTLKCLNGSDALKKNNKEETQRDEELLNSKMKSLMMTFEEASQGLELKLDQERAVIKRQLEDEFKQRLTLELSYTNSVIDDLKRRADEATEEREHLTEEYEEQMRKLGKLYIDRLKEARRYMKLELQRKLYKAHREWQQTMI